MISNMKGLNDCSLRAQSETLTLVIMDLPLLQPDWEPVRICLNHASAASFNMRRK